MVVGGIAAPSRTSSCAIGIVEAHATVPFWRVAATKPELREFQTLPPARYGGRYEAPVGGAELSDEGGEDCSTGETSIRVTMSLQFATQTACVDGSYTVDVCEAGQSTCASVVRVPVKGSSASSLPRSLIDKMLPKAVPNGSPSATLIGSPTS